VDAARVAEVRGLDPAQLPDVPAVVVDFAQEQVAVGRGAMAVGVQLDVDAGRGYLGHLRRIHQLQYA